MNIIRRQRSASDPRGKLSKLLDAAANLDVFSCLLFVSKLMRIFGREYFVNRICGFDKILISDFWDDGSNNSNDESNNFDGNSDNSKNSGSYAAKYRAPAGFHVNTVISWSSYE